MKRAVMTLMWSLIFLLSSIFTYPDRDAVNLHFDFGDLKDSQAAHQVIDTAAGQDHGLHQDYGLPEDYGLPDKYGLPEDYGLHQDYRLHQDYGLHQDYRLHQDYGSTACKDACIEYSHCSPRAPSPCACDIHGQEYPYCCKEDCGLSGVCVDGSCTCLSSGAIWPDCDATGGCDEGVQCQGGAEGGCGPHAHCDDSLHVCVCDQHSQDYPDCCQDCRRPHGSCVRGSCQCGDELCGGGKICRQVGGLQGDVQVPGRLECTCRQYYVLVDGVCKPCNGFTDQTPGTVTQQISLDTTTTKRSTVSTTPNTTTSTTHHVFTTTTTKRTTQSTTQRTATTTKRTTQTTTQRTATTTKRTTQSTTASTTTRRSCTGGQGAMVQKDLPQQGGSIQIRCDGGCIRLHKVRYNCCLNGLEPIPKDLSAANRLCKGEESCELRNFDQIFGNPNCQGTRALWLWYSCDGGIDRTTWTPHGLDVCVGQGLGGLLGWLG